jgi:hypothetical protein
MDGHQRSAPAGWSSANRSRYAPPRAASARCPDHKQAWIATVLESKQKTPASAAAPLVPPY